MDMVHQSPKHLKLKKNNSQTFQISQNIITSSPFFGGSAINPNRCPCEKAWFQDLLEFSKTFQSVEAILRSDDRSDVKLDGWMTK